MSLVEIAEEIRHDGLEPVMDARVLNLDQARALHHPETPEADSLLEIIAVNRHRIPAEVVVALEAFGWLLVETNGREGEIQRGVAGRLESVAARAYVARVGADRLAGDLREPLRTIADLRNPRRPNPSDRRGRAGQRRDPRRRPRPRGPAHHAHRHAPTRRAQGSDPRRLPEREGARA